MNEFSQVQLRTFRTFLTFSLLVLFTSLSIMVSNSQKFRISEIEYVLDNQLEFQSLNLLYGKSIWFVDENSFDQVYKDNPEVKNLSITKEIPNKLIITFDLYEELTNIVDLRSSMNNIIILYENTFTSRTENINKNLPIVEISNGPVQIGFNGEIISFFKTLDNYEYTKSLLKVSYDGNGLEAYYGETIYELGGAVDLGIKASVLGNYLSSDACNGIIRFVTSVSTIEDCK